MTSSFTVLALPIVLRLRSEADELEDMKEVKEEMLDFRLPRFRSAIGSFGGSSKLSDSLDRFFHRERVCESDSFDTCRVSSVRSDIVVKKRWREGLGTRSVYV